MSPWDLQKGGDPVRSAAMAGDVAVALVLLLVCGALSEAWCKRLGKFQISLRGSLLAVATVSLPLSWLGSQVTAYRNEGRILDACDNMKHDVSCMPRVMDRLEWRRGGPSWLRAIAGNDHAQVFDRVTALSLADEELPLAAELHDLSVLDVCSVAPAQNVKCLERMPHLEALTMWRQGLGKPEENDKEGPTVPPLPVLPNLKGLSVQRCALRSEQLRNLAGSPQLQVVDLTDTPIDDRALAYLSQATQLKRLFLLGTNVSDAGLRNFTAFRELEELRIGSLNVTDAGLAYLSLSIDLKELIAEHSNISGPGLVHLSGMKRLRRLSLGHNPLTDVGLIHLKALEQLKFVDLRDTRVTAAGVEDLQKALPNAEIVY